MIYTHAAAALASLAIGFTGGWWVQGWRWDSADLKRLETQRSEANKQIRVIDKASEGYEGDRSATKTQFVTIYKEVERIVKKPIYEQICFDDEALSLIKRAINGEATE